ncbi:MAG: BON domain-containing protein [Pleurocapsa sp. MO_192.B19]|nr:BON domain-containing protein [Pleurocapsa sp. MO_192.B19]
MNIKLNPLNLLLIVLVATSLGTLGACQERTALLVEDSSTSIAIERTGLDGEYDPSGLAKRVAKAFSEDPTLKDISTIYVAQNNRNIILKGSISDRNLLEKLVEVAQNVEGVSKVDASQVEVF